MPLPTPWLLRRIHAWAFGEAVHAELKKKFLLRKGKIIFSFFSFLVYLGVFRIPFRTFKNN